MPNAEETQARTTGKKSVADHIRHLLGRIVKLEHLVQVLQEGDSKQDDALRRRIDVLESRLGLMESGNGPQPGAADETDRLLDSLVSGPTGSTGPTGNMPPAPATALPDNEIIAQMVELETRLRQVEDENRELADLCNLLREQNQSISNLYVAKHRLHASLDAGEIMRIITDEILKELVGAEEFAIYFLEQRKKLLRRVAGHGEGKHEETVPLDSGLLGRVATVGKPFFNEDHDAESRTEAVPLAVIPLRADEHTIGVIAIYRLLHHKNILTPVDHQLLELVADHAPQALRSARLHRLSKSQSKP